MRFMSVCSGIEAASVAWGPLGWEAAALAEIDPFAAHVLHHRHSSCRPMHMPSPDEAGITTKEKRRRAAAIKAVADLPERTNGAPNFGDLNSFKEWPDATFDVLVGGTPCQSFSVAGLRKGLDDPRGNLALVFLAIADRYRPRWLLWENVPGVLSSKGGRDFGAFTGGVGELGYGWAYRVLDAQYVRVDGFGRAVPQRRRRVFLVGYLGDWRRAAAVLFERESLSGNPAPCRSTGQGVARPIASSAPGGSGHRNDADTAENLVAGTLGVRTTDHPNGMKSEADFLVAGTLQNSGRAAGSATQQDVEAGLVIPILEIGKGSSSRGAGPNGSGIGANGDPMYTLQAGAQHAVAFAPERARALTTSNQRIDAETETLIVAHSLRADGFDASEDGTGRGTPLVSVQVRQYLCPNCGGQYAAKHKSCPACLRAEPIAFNARQNPDSEASGCSQPLDTNPHTQAIAFSAKDYGADASTSVAPTLRAGGHTESQANAGVMPTIAIPFDTTQITSAKNYSRPQAGDPCHPLAAGAHPPTAALQSGAAWAVRRLMPVECERLQGFADDYTLIPYRGRLAADGPRYKALGNSMAVNAMRWLGTRIQMVEDLGLDKPQASEQAST